MKLLLTGDVHVGRASSSVPEDRIKQYLAASAWERIVDAAIDQGVAAVLVSGDLVEQSNRYFEARGPIEAGLRRLTERGIRTVAVAGNHDHDILPRFADEFASRGLAFELLGRNGTWSETRIAAGGESVTVLGWSFPRGEVREDPLGSFRSEAGGAAATIGLVHGDLGVASSKYAPLDASMLESKPVAGWLLGHIHARSLRAAAGVPWILYPGSPQALDPGETGVHGAWIAEVSGRTVSVPRAIPLSTVRYERHRVDVSGRGDAGGLRVAIDGSVQDLADRSRADGGRHLTDLVVDLEVFGATAAASSVAEVLGELSDIAPVGPLAVRVRTTSDRTTPPLDLEALAGGHGLPGLLSRAILALEAGNRDAPEAKSLLQKVLPLRDEIRLQSTVRRGDVEEPATLDETFFRDEAIKTARTLLASIIDASSEGGEP